MSEQTRLIEVTIELIDTFGGRTLDGRRLSYEWGEPTATIGDERGITRDVWTPTITATDDGMVVVERAEVAALTAEVHRLKTKLAEEPLRKAAQAFLDAAALESMTKAPEYIKAKRALRAALR